jgi:hypothetical protein
MRRAQFWQYAVKCLHYNNKAGILEEIRGCRQVVAHPLRNRCVAGLSSAPDADKTSGTSPTEEMTTMSKRTLVIRATSFLALLTLLITGAANVSAQKKRATAKPKPKLSTYKKPPAKPAIPVYTVAVGSKMRVRLNDALNSKTAKAGDTFTVTVVDPVYAEGGAVVIPAGSTMTGKVTAAEPAKRGNKPGTIDVSFVSVKLPTNATQAINGSLTDLDANKTESDNEGTVSGDKIDKRRIIFIGGGAAGGAILGAIIGGGKATGIGAIAGAGAGVAADLLLKGPEAEVKPGTEFGVILNQAVSMQEYKGPAAPQ